MALIGGRNFGVNFSPASELEQLMRGTYIDFDAAINLVIKKSAKVNTVDACNRSLLHLAVMHRPSYIPALLELGCDPTLKDHRGKTALDYMFARLPENKQTGFKGNSKIECALALIQHGAVIDDKNKIELLLYMKLVYPNLKDILLKLGVPENKVDNLDYIFSSVNLAQLRLALQYNYPEYLAKVALLNLSVIVMLELINRENHLTHDLTEFHRLPIEIINMIVETFAGNAHMPRQPNQDLKAYVTHIIKELASGPIPAQVCYEYGLFKQNTIAEAKHQHPFWDKLIGKDITNTANNSLVDFRSKHNLTGLIEAGLSFYTGKPAQQLAFLESVSSSEMYKDEGLNYKIGAKK